MLVLNGFELDASVDDAEGTILQLAAGQLARPDFTAWVKAHAVPLKRSS
jgi:prophage maintenance system killer protein